MDKNTKKLVVIQSIVIALLIVAVSVLFYLFISLQASTKTTQDSLAQQIFELQTKK